MEQSHATRKSLNNLWIPNQRTMGRFKHSLCKIVSNFKLKFKDLLFNKLREKEKILISTTKYLTYIGFLAPLVTTNFLLLIFSPLPFVPTSTSRSTVKLSDLHYFILLVAMAFCTIGRPLFISFSF